MINGIIKPHENKESKTQHRCICCSLKVTHTQDAIENPYILHKNK